MKNNLRVLPLSGTATAAVAALLFSPLFAQASDFTDSAQVISSSPIIERVREERQDCSNVPPPQAAPHRERSFAGSIVGGLAGAILGSQVGQGRGNTAATVVGAVAGAVVGDRIDNRAPQQQAQGPAPRCAVIESSREVVKGYNVVYRYNGRDIATTMPYNPGSRVTVGVGVIEDRQPVAALGDYRQSGGYSNDYR
ncbi:MAG: glycine zipper 2TM domain-containing protein [Burkholderiaceae bacterium]